MNKKLLKNLCKRFARDESGVFAVIFALMAIVLISTTGAVVDYSMMQQVRKRAQISIDSAALSLQDDIKSKSEAQLKSATENILDESIDDVGVVISNVLADVTLGENRLYLEAKFTVPTSFLALLNYNEIAFTVYAEATRDANRLEVALVLDNSGSMGGTPLSNLKTAAKNAVDILYGADEISSDMFMSVIPFNVMVNVGPDNETAPWMDGGGLSSISSDNFDTDDDEDVGPTYPLPRFGIYFSMPNVTWTGCVEARIHPYDITDEPPVSANTRFIPSFAPDITGDSEGGQDYLSDTGDSCVSGGGSTSGGSTSGSGWGGWGGWGGGSGGSSGGSGGWGGWGGGSGWGGGWGGWGGSFGHGGGGGSGGGGSSLSDRELQERICKYEGATYSGSSSSGPNDGCMVDPLLPLSNVKQDVHDNIDQMSANGGTNIHMGAAWGWRTLSPGAPFEEGADYDTATSKIMIVMTDGNNTISHNSDSMNGGDHISAYGFPYNERLGPMSWSKNQLQDEMDVRTVETCVNAKAAGIDVYTIGLGNGVNVSMLQACASDLSKAYFPATPADLNSTFTDIADRLAPLRLAK